MLRYLDIYWVMLRNSLVREMHFKANFLLWMLVELLWFTGQIAFLEVLFQHVNQLGDWSKWEVVLLVGTHQIIAQIFQAFFYVNLTNLPELVRTGRLDLLLLLPVDPQFAVSTRQFGLDNLLNALVGLGIVLFSLTKLGIHPSPSQIFLYTGAVALGVTIHYSILLSLNVLTFWTVRAQGLVTAYFHLLGIGRYPETVFHGTFKVIFSFLLPVLLVANVPAKALTRTFENPTVGILELAAASALSLYASRRLWTHALRRYASASS